MKTAAFAPLLSNTAAATAFVEQTLEAEGCPQPIIVKACIVIDELFSNIARYSGATEASVSCGVIDSVPELTLRDDGVPYDPTAAAVPNVSLDAEDREIGGLGIHMVRNFADSLRYTRKNGWNTLHVKMSLSRDDCRSDSAEEIGGETE